MVASEWLVYSPSGRPIRELSLYCRVINTLKSWPPQTQEFILSIDGKTVKEDTSPSLEKIYPVPHGFMVRSVNGLRIRMVRRLDGRGYDVTKCRSLPMTHHTDYIH